MDISSINWWAVLICVFVSMVSGSLWYSPKTFFPVWWEGVRKHEAQTPVAMAFMVPAMGKVMSAGHATAANGAMTGFMLWLGFIAPTYLVNKLFAGHSSKIWAIEVGNHLINFVLFGIILGAWY
jgi:hypothetical protein